uniref:50S ribosomal protein L6 n=1 Tax=Corynoplastis japonica TaxID=700918 RepID=A0A1X9PTZ3_9RHOD|nr:50S ribosomal protein L6 [Corynoplastis japonica]
MSSLTKKIIQIPSTVDVKIDNQLIEVEGPKGSLTRVMHSNISIQKVDDQIIVNKRLNNRLSNQLYGLTRTIINNMVIGVSTGFEKHLEIRGVGYRSQIEGTTLILNIGYTNPVKIIPSSDIKIQVENNTKITVSGYDKEILGEMASYIRSIRSPEPYKGKGIRYQGEVVVRFDCLLIVF